MTTDPQAAMDRPPPMHRVAAAQQPGATGPLDGPALASVLELARSAAPTLTATDLADQAGYSPFHFSRLFTARLGIGPGQYLTALRIDAAKRLLLSDSDPVVDVATAVGFDSLSSFSRRFRETVGVPPGQLRRLADRVADREPAPFALPGADARAIRVHLDLPAAVEERGDALVWVGWYPQPAPIGLPAAGVLVRGERRLSVPLCPAAPWLLGFAIPSRADVLYHLAPERPVVAAHPLPLHAPGDLTLHFSDRGGLGVPLLSALPSLCRA